MIKSTQTIAIIEKIYQVYEAWASGLQLACHRGCAACCTRNVTMTRAEGELILAAIQQESRLEWFISRLQVKGHIGRPLMSTNEWARRCLEGQEVSGEEPEQVLTPCPFLDRKLCCSLYPLRPFACRCFGSSVDCATSGMAEQPDILIEINTVTMQLIEHLGRGGWWGNMLDVLSALILQTEVKQVMGGEQRLEETTGYLHRAKPLPGFLVMPAQQTAVQAYLNDLLAIQIGRTNIGEILQIPL